MIEKRSQDMEGIHFRGTKATFATGEFDFKNLLNTERPTSETISSIYVISVSEMNGGKKRINILLSFSIYKNIYSPFLIKDFIKSQNFGIVMSKYN